MAKPASRRGRGSKPASGKRRKGVKLSRRRTRPPEQRRPRPQRPGDRARGPAKPKADAEPSPEPCVGWLRRHGTAVWIDPEPDGKALFVRDGSADDCPTDEAVRFTIAQAGTYVTAAEATVAERLGSAGSDATLLKMATANLGLPMEFPADVRQVRRGERG